MDQPLWFQIPGFNSLETRSPPRLRLLLGASRLMHWLQAAGDVPGKGPRWMLDISG